jgi:pimeloyl-ACP methyl ester carboxylesterase
MPCCGAAPSKSGRRQRLFTMLLFFAGCCIGAACHAPEHDLFHVERAGARLPVVVAGNQDANTLVIFQHGGPDGSAGIDPLPPGLARLTNDALVAVWGQRSTTLASGLLTTRDNTIAQHVADLHAVRLALAERYPQARRLVLAGHSWGVALTLAYLGHHGEAGVAGLVLTDGFDAYDDNAERSFGRLAELAGAHIDDEADHGEYWRQTERFAREQMQSGAPYALETIVKASEACARLEAELDRPEPVDVTATSLGAVTSPLLLPDGLLVAWNFRSMIKELMNFDVAEQLVNRHVPALLVWGESDCRVPVATATSMRARYGGEATLVVVDGATHFALYSQPRAFAEATLDFFKVLP